MDYRIFPPEEILEVTVNLPLSKSIAARALVMNAIGGLPKAARLPECDDTAVLSAVLAQGLDGTVDVGPAGTAMRFVCALAAATPGVRCTLRGSERMHRRPIGPLVEALRALGAKIEYLESEGFPPLAIEGRKLTGGTVEIDAGVSSQFISALMMVTPLMSAPLTVELKGQIGSLPYIKMTASMMANRGVAAEVEPTRILVPNTPYTKAADDAEPDWSAAAFWYETAALSAGWLTLPGLKEHSLQGDSEAAELFAKLGVLTEFTAEGAELSASPEIFNGLDVDMGSIPDLVPALAVTAAMAGVPFRFSGIGSLHAKECDRIEALITELAKLGFLLETEAYGTTLVWDGRRVPIHQMPVFDTYSDHRMAMALAPVAVFVPGIVVRNAEVVSKSYPQFWEHLQEAGFRLAHPADPIENVD